MFEGKQTTTPTTKIFNKKSQPTEKKLFKRKTKSQK